MPAVGQPEGSSDHCAESSKSCAASDQEHYEELIFDGLGRVGACKDLTSHHARQRNQSDCRHCIDNGHEAAPERVSGDG
jgi:hypothetical protein